MLRVTSLMLRPSLGAAWLAWKIWPPVGFCAEPLAVAGPPSQRAAPPAWRPRRPSLQLRTSGPYRLANRSMKSGLILEFTAAWAVTGQAQNAAGYYSTYGSFTVSGVGPVPNGTTVPAGCALTAAFSLSTTNIGTLEANAVAQGAGCLAAINAAIQSFENSCQGQVPRIASAKMLPDALVASGGMLPATAAATIVPPTNLEGLWEPRCRSRHGLN